MIVTVKGIVLKSIQYGDFDKLCTILTEEGKFFFKARGIRSLTNKNAAGCQSFVYSEFILEQRAEKYYLRKAQPLYTTLKAGSDIQTIALASYFAELCEDTALDAETGKITLKLLMNALYLLAKADRPLDLIKGVFELRLLAAGGLSPLLEECALCGKPYDAEPHLYVRLLDGDFVCRNCLSSRDQNIMKLSRRAAEIVHRSVSVSEKDAYAIRVAPEILQEFSRFCERFLLAQLDRGYQTLDFYKEVKKLPEN